MNHPQQININEVCRVFEIEHSDISYLKFQGSLNEVEKRLKQFKKIIKEAYRKLAFKCHPDRGASPDKVEQFKTATQMKKQIDNIQVVQIPKPQQTVVVRFYSSFDDSSTASTSTTKCSFSSHNANRWEEYVKTAYKDAK